MVTKRAIEVGAAVALVSILAGCAGWVGRRLHLEQELRQASKRCDLARVKLLVSRGAPLNPWSPGRHTPLIVAVVRDDAPTVKAWLERGAEVGVRDLGGKSAINVAGLFAGEEAVRLLLQHGADANARDLQGGTALRSAAERDLGVVQALIAAGAEVNAAPQSGLTPLMSATVAGRTDIMRVLLSHGARVEAEHRREGETALSLAACGEADQSSGKLVWKPHAEAVRLLLDHGAEIDHRNDAGETPLMQAARRGYARVVRLLLVRGADTRLRDRQGLSALDWAKRRGKEDVVAILAAAHLRAY